MADDTAVVGPTSSAVAPPPPPAASGAGPATLRVTYDHTAFAAQAHGGISRYFFELIHRVARSPGASVSVYMGGRINLYGLERHHESFERFAGWRRVPLPRTNGLALWLGNRLFERFVSAAPPHVYHATYYTRLAPGLRAARVVTVHDCTAERLMGPLNPALQTAVDAADGVVCVSERTRADLMELYGVPERKTRVVYHGNSLRGVTPGPPPVAGPYILYVGTRYMYKNFRTLLLAYGSSRRLRGDFRLVCFGGGPLKQSEWEDVAGQGLLERVHIVPAGDDAALAGAYAHAAALAYPSLYEGFGMPMVEAMGLGCPVVCSDASCLPEIAGGAASLFDPIDARSLAARLEAVVYDAGERERLRSAGLARERAFSWDRAAAETLDFYRTVAGG